MIRNLQWIFASIMLFALSACVSSDERLMLGDNVKLLPEHALLHLDQSKNAEFYKVTFSKDHYVAVQKGDEDDLMTIRIHKLPGLPVGYYVGWVFLGKGTSFESNYYNFVWMGKSSSGREQIVLFAPSDKTNETIAKEMGLTKGTQPQIKSAEDMVRYAQIVSKLDDDFKKLSFDIYDLSKKDDFKKANTLVGTAFLND